MRVVVADTSPINYLVLIDRVDILRQLYTRIVIPEEVFSELTAVGAPHEVATWVRTQPAWIEVRSVANGEPRALRPANPSWMQAKSRPFNLRSLRKTVCC